MDNLSENLKKAVKKLYNSSRNSDVFYKVCLEYTDKLSEENKKLRTDLTVAIAALDGQKREYLKLLKSRNALKGQITKLKK